MKKLLNKKGFTLMEMMIVVAIIVILVAISIPTFSGSLNKANEATDAANLRAAKAVVTNAKISGSAEQKGYYDYETSTFKATISDGADKGKCNKHKDAYIYSNGTDVKWVKVAADGTHTDAGECGSN